MVPVAISKSCCISWVAQAIRVSGLRSVTGSVTEILTGNWCVLVEGFFDLIFYFAIFHIRNVMPGVVLSRAVDLSEVFVGGIDLVSGLVRIVPSHVAEEDC